METIKGYRVIKTTFDVACFISYLVWERKVNVNPDDSFADYVSEDGTPTFTPEEVKCFDSMMDVSWELCKTMDVDIYEMTMRIIAIYYLCDGNSELKAIYDELK